MGTQNGAGELVIFGGTGLGGEFNPTVNCGERETFGPKHYA